MEKLNFAFPDFQYLGKKRHIDTPAKLKEALLEAASDRKLKTRKVYDCEHMLFNKQDIGLIRSFPEYIKHFDFGKFGG